MRVLLTNNTLDRCAGTELYVRDVAVELMRRGHQPVAYSTQLGKVAELLRAAGVRVVESLACLEETPDIIHGHHHYETLTAMLRFPSTPAIYYCHGWLPWQEAPLLVPGILRYVAVDEPCRERLLVEGGIAAGNIELILNFFDGEAFQPRPALPASPRLALAFGNHFGADNSLPVLREACQRCGIELHSAGIATGNPAAEPGRMLGAYDIVFAKARSAIEAMAVGAAVVLCANGRLGPMVTTGQFAPLRRLNFGVQATAQPLDADSVVSELKRYNPEDAAEVSRLVRENCELEQAVDRIVRLYEQVIEEARQSPLAGPAERARAAASYLEYWAAQYKQSFATDADRERWIAHHRPEVLLVQQELAAVKSSATWRWSRKLLGNALVERLFGAVIRPVAARSQRGARSASVEDRVFTARRAKVP